MAVPISQRQIEAAGPERLDEIGREMQAPRLVGEPDEVFRNRLLTLLVVMNTPAAPTRLPGETDEEFRERIKAELGINGELGKPAPISAMSEGEFARAFRKEREKDRPKPDPGDTPLEGGLTLADLFKKDDEDLSPDPSISLKTIKREQCDHCGRWYDAKFITAIKTCRSCAELQSESTRGSGRLPKPTKGS